MSNRYAIVIAVDGLRASALGAYGNTWHPTPALDRLASESVVFDWVIADSPQLAGFYRAAWFGADPPRNGVERELAGLEAASSISNVLASQRVQLALTTDDQWLAEQADQLGFVEVRGLEFAEPAAAEAVADTELAQLFAVAADQIEHWQAAESDATQDDAPPRLLWIHARGYHGAWDAPLELRQSLLDEEDPAPSENVVPPSRLESSDDDELLIHRAAYAAQTIVLDECIGMLLETLAAAAVADSTLVALIGCRGFALGEHGAVGTDALDLYGEVTHVPLMIRLPGGGPPPPPRMGSLAQPRDLGPILSRWFEASQEDASSLAVVAGGDAAVARPTAFSVGPANELALRTNAWALRRFIAARPDGTEAPAVELFSKPDDRWEANEIADRCPEETASLLAVADEFLAQATAS